MSDPIHVLCLNEVADYSETDGYLIEIVEAPPGPGVMAARVGVPEDVIITDAILRASADDCDGVPHYVYFIDDGFTPPIEYLMRWHGAGVANQSFVISQVIDTQAEGMKDGSFVCTLLNPSGVLEVLSNSLRFSSATIILATQNLLNMGAGTLGLFLTKDGNASAEYTGFGDAQNQYGLMYAAAAATANRFGAARQQGPNIQVAGVGLTASDAGGSEHGLLIGGFDVNGVPDVTGRYGGRLFQRAPAGAWTLLYVLHSALIGATAYFRLYTSTAAPISYEYVAVPDHDFSDMLVPLAMDTFEEADSTALDGKAAIIGSNWTVYAGSYEIRNNGIWKLTAAYGAAGLEIGTQDFISRGVHRNNPKWSGLSGRIVDGNNFIMGLLSGTSARIDKMEGGTPSILASAAGSFPNPCNMELIMDGTLSLFVVNDATVVSYPTMPAGINGTKAGISGYDISTLNSALDNFSVYPRRSTTQYDDAIQPYVDAIPTAPATNP